MQVYMCIGVAIAAKVQVQASSMLALPPPSQVEPRVPRPMFEIQAVVGCDCFSSDNP